MQSLQILISGIAQGCIYGLVALGFVLIYKATETVNFALGELMMLGAFAGLLAYAGWSWPLVLAMLFGVGVMVLFGLGFERTVLRPILGQPSFAIFMVTLGLGFVARGAITMVPNVGTETLALDVSYRYTVFNWGGVVVSATHLIVILVTAALSAGLFALFRYTKVGIAMQASSQNQLAAYYMGIPVKQLNTLVWGLSAGVAALAGLLLAPITFVHANMGLIALKAFPAAVVGGFSSLPGAIVGGIIIGVVEAFAGFWLPEGFKDAAPWAVVLLMLWLKPNGLFGETGRKKV